MFTFAIRKQLRAGFDEALVGVRKALGAEGFGVLTEIDVQSTLAQKLGVGFRRYQILGACAPPFAHAALTAELEIGVMLPCNVVVYEGDDQRAVVVAVDPTQTIAAAGNPALVDLAASVKQKLERALAKLD
jgi:uncharacterized protein (DUF302 family)